jgi:hypothetical protein
MQAKLAGIFRKDGRRTSLEATCLVQIQRKNEEQAISLALQLSITKKTVHTF